MCMEDSTDAVGKKFSSINQVPKAVIEDSELATVKTHDGEWKVITQEQWEGRKEES